MTNEKIIEMFIATLGSDSSKTTYNTHITEFVNTVGKEITDITPLDCSNYVNTRYAKLKVSTRNMRVQILKSFSKFCFENEITNVNFAKSIKALRGESEPKDILTTKEVEAMAKRGNKREKAILAVFANTGIRISELLSLTLDDFQYDCIKVKVKGGRYRKIYLSDDTRNIVKAYLAVRKESDGCDKLFTSNGGHELNPDNINKAWKKLARKAGIEKDVTNHSFRRLVVTKLVNKYGIAVAKEFIGHANVQTTMRYYQPDEEQIKNIMKEGRFVY